MEFLILAYDGTDPEAKARRLRVREAHLSGVREMKEAGTFINYQRRRNSRRKRRDDWLDTLYGLPDTCGARPVVNQ